MTVPSPTPTQPQPQRSDPTPVRCFSGALIASPLAFGMYLLTAAIATTFAEKPVSMSNPLAANISVMVRTLVVGVCALGTAIFAIATIGLVALGIQLLFKKASTTEREPTQG